MNQALSTAGTEPQTMSSREIAELTGKRHDNVTADIRSMFEQLEVHSPEFSGEYQDSTGRTLPCFHLDRFHTEVLITGYDVKRRAAVIERWYDLEAKARDAAPALSYYTERKLLAQFKPGGPESRLNVMRYFEEETREPLPRDKELRTGTLAGIPCRVIRDGDHLFMIGRPLSHALGISIPQIKALTTVAERRELDGMLYFALERMPEPLVD